MSSATPKIPGYLALFVGIAIGILWLVLLALAIAIVIGGMPLNLSISQLIPGSIEGAMRTALLVQYASTFLSLAVLFVFGNMVIVTYLVGIHDFALQMAIWLARAMAIILFLQVIVSGAMPYATGGLVGILPVVLLQLPMVLVTIGLVLMAERALVRIRADQ